MDKRFVVCGLVVSLASLLLGLLVHGMLLRADYAALAASGFVRGGNAQDFLPYVFGAHALSGFGLTWLYRQISPRGERSLTRGLRFGAGMVLAAVLPGVLALYALQPWPAALVHRQMLYGSAAMLVLGLLLGYLQPRRAHL